MTKNQYRGFAGDARNFAEFEDVGDEVTQDDHGLRRKLLDVFGESAQIHSRRINLLSRFAVQVFCSRIQFAAADKSAAMKSGFNIHFEACQRISPSPYPVRTMILRAPTRCANSTSLWRSPITKERFKSTPCAAEACCNMPGSVLRHAQASAEV